MPGTVCSVQQTPPLSVHHIRHIQGDEMLVFDSHTHGASLESIFEQQVVSVKAGWDGMHAWCMIMLFLDLQIWMFCRPCHDVCEQFWVQLVLPKAICAQRAVYAPSVNQQQIRS